MKMHFIYLVSVTMNFPVYYCVGYTVMGDDIANVLVEFLNTDREEINDLPAADELVRGLTFDLYDEKISCDVMGGILLDDYQTVVEEFAESLSLPQEIKNALLMAQNLERDVLNFKFQKGGNGTYVYGRVASMKHEDSKMDMASAVYTLDFKFSPKVIEHREKKIFCWFTTGTKVWHETEERNLPTNEKDKLQEHLKIKAISKFRSEYGELIEASSTKYLDNEL